MPSKAKYLYFLPDSSFSAERILDSSSSITFPVFLITLALLT